MRVYDLITRHLIPWPPPVVSDGSQGRLRAPIGTFECPVASGTQLCLFSKCLPRGEARLDRTASWRSLELGAAVRCRAEDAWREYD